VTSSTQRLGFADASMIDGVDTNVVLPDPTLLASALASNVTPGAAASTPVVSVIHSGGVGGTHMTINVSYDASVTALNTVGNAAYNPTLYANYVSAVNAAVAYYQTTFTTPISVNITFGWGNVGGTTDTVSAGALGQSNAQYTTTTYTALRAAVLATDTTNPAQIAAAATLPATDPTNGGLIIVTTAEAKALGLSGASTASDGGVGINSSYTYAFSQSSVASSGNYDAVGVLEHEISEILGRAVNGGSDLFSTGQQDYGLLDFFRYTAAGNSATASPGTAVGSLDQPFVAGYNAATQSYFSFNGTTITQPFGAPSDIASGGDIADWGTAVTGDAFGSGIAGVVGAITPTDQQVLSVLGFSGIACYAAGTSLATTSGDVAVEELAIGDMMLTLDGPPPAGPLDRPSPHRDRPSCSPRGGAADSRSCGGIRRCAADPRSSALSRPRDIR